MPGSGARKSGSLGVRYSPAPLLPQLCHDRFIGKRLCAAPFGKRLEDDEHRGEVVPGSCQMARPTEGC